jgi:hypothetical protein
MSAVQLKIFILVIMLLMIVSLFNGLFVLFKDNGAPDSKRTFYRLVIRVSLAVTLLASMIYGFYSGKLVSRAPWNNPATVQQPSIQNP